VTCGACGHDRLAPRWELTDASARPVRLSRCRGCGLVQAEPRPSDEELRAYYARYCYDADAAWEASAATQASLDRLASLLAPFRRTGFALDVGAGAGDILRTLRRHGWNAEGSELSTTAAERLAREGFAVHAGAIQSVPLPRGRYDVVILSEVIEHLPAPREALAAAAAALRPGGAVYLTTPNFGSLSRRVLGTRWRPIEVPEHLFYFDGASLRRLLVALRLRPLRIWTDGLNPYALWGGLRGGRDPEVLREGVQQAEALRARAVRSPFWRGVKASASAGLRVLRLGDTLKALAERT